MVIIHLLVGSEQYITILVASRYPWASPWHFINQASLVEAYIHPRVNPWNSALRVIRDIYVLINRSHKTSDCKGRTNSSLVSEVIKSVGDRLNIYVTVRYDNEFTQANFTFGVAPVVGIA